MNIMNTPHIISTAMLRVISTQLGQHKILAHHRNPNRHNQSRKRSSCAISNRVIYLLRVYIVHTLAITPNKSITQQILIKLHLVAL